jgi:hypothetical protein
VALFCGLIGCVTSQPSTRIESIWTDPHFNTADIKHLLVIGVIADPVRRKLFEDTFTHAIKSRDHFAYESYPIWPSLTGIQRAEIEKVVKEKDMDAVMITRLVDQKTTQTEVQGQQKYAPSASPLDGAVSYFNESEKVVTSPGQAVDQTDAVLETKVFDIQKGACVWSGRSHTQVQGYLDDLISSYSQVVSHALFP